MSISRYQINIFAFAGTPTEPSLPWIGGQAVDEATKDQLESLLGNFPACVDMDDVADYSQERVNQYCTTDESREAFNLINNLMGLCWNQHPESNCCLVDVTYLGVDETVAAINEMAPEPMPF